MKFTLATIAIAAVGVSAVEFNGDAHLASFRKAMTQHESHPRRLATRAQNVLTSAASAASARKFDTLGAVPGAMSDECMAAYTDAMSGMEDPAVSSALASPDAAVLAEFCGSAVYQGFQTAWAAVEAACTADELGEKAAEGLGLEVICLKVDGEYCMLQFADTTGSTSGEDFECLDGLKSVPDSYLCDDMDDCADRSDETHASCPTAADIAAETAAACGGCLWEIIKMSAAITGEDTTVLKVMMDIQCLRGSEGEYCANVDDDEMCTSTCQRDTLNTFFALVDADEEMFCGTVVTVDGEDDMVTDMEDSLESSFEMFCDDDAGATMLTFLDINCMTNADGELCKDVMEDSPGAVCPEEPCGETTCSTACKAEMQSYADVAGCCASEISDVADSITPFVPEVGCAMAFFDTCGVSFTSEGCTENKVFVENGGISAGAGGLDGITLADGSTLGAGVRAQFSLFSVVFAALAVAFHA